MKHPSQLELPPLSFALPARWWLDQFSTVARCPKAARDANFVFLLWPRLPLLFFLSAFCHLACSSSWVTHLHGQCFTMPRLSSLVLFHAVWLGFSLCLLFGVPTRCAAHLLFMNACKATSAEANGTGTLPCSSVNNAFGTNLPSFKGIGGLLDGGTQCCLGALWILAHVPSVAL